MAFGPTGGGTCVRRCARLSIPANARACPHIKPSRRPFRLSALCSNRVEQLQTALVARGLTLYGVTTDGSALYPAPLRAVFGKVRHHICQLHIVAEVVKAVVGAVASARKGLAAQQPKLRKGRPSTPAA